MRACTEEDFTSMDYEPDDVIKKKIKDRKLLCLDYNPTPELDFKVFNTYNYKDRYSFSIQVSICNNDHHGGGCKSDQELKEFSTAFIYNINILQKKTELKKDGHDLLKTTFKLHS